jgi:uncharacterized protein (DUF427 family)
MWNYDGRRRPDFAETPGPGQESVWDYPRPPRLKVCRRTVVVSAGGHELARSTRALRVCETASPPTYYIPGEDVNLDALRAVPGESFCEWKGTAQYWGLVDQPEREAVGWSYPEPNPAFADLQGCIAFYPGRVECTVDGERVRPQPSHFYGGWVTDELVGPWKGEPGTESW